MCFMRLSWHFNLQKSEESGTRNRTIASFPLSSFCSLGPVLVHTKKASERGQSRRQKTRDRERGGLVKRENSEPLHAVQYHMTSKAGLRVKELRKLGGCVCVGACGEKGVLVSANQRPHMLSLACTAQAWMFPADVLWEDCVLCMFLVYRLPALPMVRDTLAPLSVVAEANHLPSNQNYLLKP